MKSLYSALLGFRKDMESIKKEANNPFFKSKYADLPSILAEIKDNLVKNKLSISHATLFVDGSLVMKTTVTETESGESESSIFPIFWNKPQEVGSSMTYARRYNIQALLDLSTEDDDGNSANDAPKITKQYAQDDREWFNNPELEKLTKDLQNGEVFSKSAIKTDYKINKEMQAKLATLVAQYPSQFLA